LAESQIAASVFDPRAPYAAAWRKFDRLQTVAEMRLWFEFVDAVAIAIVTDVARGFDSRTYWTIFAGTLLFGVLVATWMRRSARRFGHWPCPRCGAEWPGTKTEKEPQCAACGLKLRQMAP